MAGRACAGARGRGTLREGIAGPSTGPSRVAVAPPIVCSCAADRLARSGGALPAFDLADLWTPTMNPLEVAVRAASVYVFVQALFRIAGRKEIERWGIPEVALLFLVTTAVRKSIVGEDTSLTSAFVALVTIVALDRLLSTITSRSRRVAELMEGPVVQLVRDGELDRRAMRRVRISEEELLARVRDRGRERLEDVKDAFFERTGRVTVVFKQ